MNYIFKGNLRVFYCEDCYDYLCNAKVRIYAIVKETGISPFAAAETKKALRQRSDEELVLLSKGLLFETETDESGNFTVSLSDTQKYNGGAFEIDFEYGSIPAHFKTKTSAKPNDPGQQFHITALQPLWKEMPDNMQTLSAHWEYGIANRFWW